jgi:hypothetical protein
MTTNPINQPVGAGEHRELEIHLGWSLLRVVDGEFRELYLPLGCSL